MHMLLVNINKLSEHQFQSSNRATISMHMLLVNINKLSSTAQDLSFMQTRIRRCYKGFLTSICFFHPQIHYLQNLAADRQLLLPIKTVVIL